MIGCAVLSNTNVKAVATFLAELKVWNVVFAPELAVRLSSAAVKR